MIPQSAIHNFQSYLTRYLNQFRPETKQVVFLHTVDYSLLAKQLSEYKSATFSYSAYEMDLFNQDQIQQLVKQHDFSIFLFDVYQIYQQGKLKEYYTNVIPSFTESVKHIMFARDLFSYFENVYAASPDIIAQHNQQLIQIAESAHTMSVTNDAQTKLTAALNKKWTNANGFNHQATLLPSEISTGSNAVNGEIYFTGVLQSQIPIGIKHGLITPEKQIYLKIIDSQIADFDCTDVDLKNDLKKYFAFCDANRKVTELGIGTNLGIKNLIGRSAPFEEKYPGFHLGLGGSERKSQHLDFIFQDSVIYFDHHKLFADGKFYL